MIDALAPEVATPLIHVLIVEDHQMVGALFAKLLQAEKGIGMVGWVTTLEAAEAHLRSNSVDVVLMDYRLPDGDGITAASDIRARYASTRVVIVTGATDEHLLKDALRAGCSGYISKTESVELLGSAVRAAHAGSTAVSPEMLARAIGPVATPSRGPDALSPRELRVLQLLADGLTADDIAERLSLSPHTVRNHAQSILTKLDAHSKLEAVSKALRAGLVKAPMDLH